MERKLVKQGRNALTVTLPAKWIRKKGLEAGDPVRIEERGPDILVSAGLKSAKRSIELNLQDVDDKLFFSSVHAAYIEGYDEIKVIHNDPDTAQKSIRYLLGFIIEKHSPKRTVYRSMIAVPEENFETVLRRATHILLTQAKTLEAMTHKDTVVWSQVKKEERLLDINLTYCLRYLNKYYTGQASYRYYLICSILENVGDQLSHIGKNIGKSRGLAKAIVKGIEDYIILLFQGDLKKMYSAMKSFKRKFGTRTYLQGLAYSLADTLYNDIGIVVKKR